MKRYIALLVVNLEILRGWISYLQFSARLLTQSSALKWWAFIAISIRDIMGYHARVTIVVKRIPTSSRFKSFEYTATNVTLSSWNVKSYPLIRNPNPCISGPESVGVKRFTATSLLPIYIHTSHIPSSIIAALAYRIYENMQSVKENIDRYTEHWNYPLLLRHISLIFLAISPLIWLSFENFHTCLILYFEISL